MKWCLGVCRWGVRGDCCLWRRVFIWSMVWGVKVMLMRGWIVCIGLFSGWFVGRAAGGVGSGGMVVGRR